MNRQELFDKAVAGLLAQDGPSVNHGGCVYIGPGNCRCAVGHLIPPEFEERVLKNYNSGISAYSLLQRIPELRPTFGIGDGDDVRFLEQMQWGLHDAIVGKVNEIQTWKVLVRQEALRFSISHNLDFPIREKKKESV